MAGSNRPLPGRRRCQMRGPSQKTCPSGEEARPAGRPSGEDALLAKTPIRRGDPAQPGRSPSGRRPGEDNACGKEARPAGGGSFGWEARLVERPVRLERMRKGGSSGKDVRLAGRSVRQERMRKGGSSGKEARPARQRTPSLAGVGSPALGAERANGLATRRNHLQLVQVLHDPPALTNRIGHRTVAARKRCRLFMRDQLLQEPVRRSSQHHATDRRQAP
jgi:hypothetical protein